MSSILDKAVKSVISGIDKAQNTFSAGMNLINDREIRIGVTGLSRGGKTALITSLVNHVLAFGGPDIKDLLPRFTGYSTGGITSGKIARPRDFAVAEFPYYKAMDALTSEPAEWPEATDGISEIRLEIECTKNRWYSIGSSYMLSLDIWDYPGEWLMDMILLDMSYEEFSELSRQRILKVGAVCPADKWVKAGSSLKPLEKINETELRKVIELYTAWLRMQKEQGFAMIVPGRFVLPGKLAGALLLEFLPWIWESVDASDVRQGSLYYCLKERYDRYRKDVVEKFYRECFSHIDRQIILVDCLKALMGGKETYIDINDSFSALLKHFSYGRSGILDRIFSPKIDRVVFCATKADSVTQDEQKNLLSLLSSMVRQAASGVRSDGSRTEYMTLSSIRAANCQIYTKGGFSSQVLVSPYDGEKPYYPGSVPSGWSRENMEFFQKNFMFSKMRPPVIEPGGIIPDINMDLLFQYILEDRL